MNAPFSYSSPTLSVEALKHSIAYKLMFTIGKDPVIANKHEWLNATLFAVRDRLVERWLRSNRAQLSQETRQVYYLSMEFLIGRTLSNALLSLGIYDDVKTALEEMGLDLEELIDEENDRASVTAVWDVLPPASSTRWRRWRCRAAATVFATTTVCSNRTSSTGARKSRRTTGWSTATRGSLSATIRATRCALADVSSRKAKNPAG